MAWVFGVVGLVCFSGLVWLIVADRRERRARKAREDALVRQATQVKREAAKAWAKGQRERRLSPDYWRARGLL